ncbi:DUF1963 domain-containing protein [Chitinophaga oryziterrae]|uniref:DUF1963 domain-containing protein n=1 Tax=Chitinophaga oryziterrae TaxID=1031224 RepID=A0A6N8JA52_9BACT|nr:DUF1963 domain-containing protein [Chitinophaga oryziterrae]
MTLQILISRITRLPGRSLPEGQKSLLAVQFQNDEGLGWADGRSAQFFIRKKDLKNLNFKTCFSIGPRIKPDVIQS